MPFPERPILVVMGVSGAGKSGIAAELAQQLGWHRVEGDDLHPAANVVKLTRGMPLTDEDRAPWLDSVGRWIDASIAAKLPGVITCSALLRIYRDRLRRPEVVFVHLDVPEDELERRVSSRVGHFMAPSLLPSQLATLELPEADEQAIIVDADRPPADTVAAVLEALELG